MRLLLASLMFLMLTACGKQEVSHTTAKPDAELKPYPVSSTPLPADLVWLTNDSDPEFADPAAQRGGTLREFVMGFPLTLRLVGPDSNGSFAGYMRALGMGLVDVHPNTLNPIPALATHWAFGEDNKTVYFRLDPDARWSDGKPVTADDFVYMLEFMRSPHIVAPFYNEHFTTQVVDIIKFDAHTLAVVSGNPKPRDELLLEQVNVRPVPRHFHHLTENWVRDYNWLPEPGTAAYSAGEVRKGKFVRFDRLPDWWANNKRFYRHRFNPDHIHVKVIRDINIAWRYFEKGELDSFGLVLPDFWHNKAKGDLFDRGYIGKVWFYNSTPQPAQGLWLNMQAAPLDDARVRFALAQCIDFDRIINTVLHGDYARLETHNVGYGDYDNKTIRPRPYDLPAAVRSLEAAGWTQTDGDGIRLKNGQRLSLSLSYGNPTHTERLVMIKEDARKAGIDLELQLLDSSAFFKQVLEKKHQLASLGWSGGGLSPEYRQFYHSENANKPQTNNITNFSDPQMDAWIDAYRNELSKPVRVALAHKMEQALFDSGAMIPTFKVPYTREAYWRWIRLPKDIATRSSGQVVDSMSLGLFWIDVAEKNRLRALKREDARLEPSLILDETWK